MKLIKVLLLLSFATGALFASNAGHQETDIVPRTVNFLIFAALVYYLLAEKIKNFFSGRTATIAKSYEDAENKIKEANAALAQAKSKKDEAKKLADEFLSSAKADSLVQAQKIAQNAEEEVSRVKKAAEEEKSLLKKKVIMDTVEESISEIIDSGGLGVDDKELATIIAKRVA